VQYQVHPVARLAPQCAALLCGVALLHFAQAQKPALHSLELPAIPALHYCCLALRCLALKCAALCAGLHCLRCACTRSNFGGFGPWRPEWTINRLPGLPMPFLGVLGREQEEMGWGTLPHHVMPYLPEGGRCEVLDEVGHFVHIERPEQVSAMVLEIGAGCRSAAIIPETATPNLIRLYIKRPAFAPVV
jgi:pimeloyl-ACP methyl ester carboxylesterase